MDACDRDRARGSLSSTGLDQPATSNTGPPTARMPRLAQRIPEVYVVAMDYRYDNNTSLPATTKPLCEPSYCRLSPGLYWCKPPTWKAKWGSAASPVIRARTGDQPFNCLGRRL